MTRRIRENLMKLNKEQLIYLIEQYHHTDFLIGETLVDQSKHNITNEKCIEKIRKYSSGTLNKDPDFIIFHILSVLINLYRYYFLKY